MTMENNIQAAIEKAKSYKANQHKNNILHFTFILIMLLLLLGVLLFDIICGSHLLSKYTPCTTSTIPFVEYEVGPQELNIQSCEYYENGKAVYCETPIQEQPKHSATFKVTYYCGCSKCCGTWSSGSESEATGAAGTKLKPFYSVAVDRKVIPLGTILTDENGNEYKAEDTGGAIKGNRIDIFTGNHQEALNQGVKEITFYWN